MEHSILSEVSQKTLAAHLIERNFGGHYWTDFFPLKKTPFLNFEVLIGSKGNPVAADIVSYDSSAPLKRRSIVTKLKGDLPAIRVKRRMSETDLNLYNVMRATMKSSTDKKAILEHIFNDVDFVTDAVIARCEWMSLQALSTGVISLTSTNNAGIVTETNIDFQMPSANKSVMAAANRKWEVANSATCLPITDIQAVCDTARAAGTKLRYVLMNVSKFTAFRSADEVKDYIYGVMITKAGITPAVAPTLNVINQVLKESGLPQIIIIDSFVSLEDDAHDRTSVDPWEDLSGADRYVTLIPDKQVGNMLHGPIAAETNPAKQATQVKVAHILVQKYSETDPVSEYTVGLANTFISWDKVDRCYIMDTESNTSFGA
jgi:hypothetical protein